MLWCVHCAVSDVVVLCAVSAVCCGVCTVLCVLYAVSDVCCGVYIVLSVMRVVVCTLCCK